MILYLRIPTGATYSMEEVSVLFTSLRHSTPILFPFHHFTQPGDFFLMFSLVSTSLPICLLLLIFLSLFKASFAYVESHVIHHASLLIADLFDMSDTRSTNCLCRKKSVHVILYSGQNTWTYFCVMHQLIEMVLCK